MTAPAAPLTVDQYLRQLGVTNPADHGLLAHVTDQHRAAHLGRYGIDPGDWIPSTRFADRVMDRITVTVCSTCGGCLDGNQADDGTCNACGTTGTRILPATRLPITLGPSGPLVCGDCGDTFTAGTYHVERRFDALRSAPTCPTCALSPETRAWQTVCEAANLIDQAMREAVDARERDLIAQKLASIAGHFAGWRWPDDQPPASPGNPD